MTCQSSCLYAYSQRLSWEFSSNSLSRLVEEKRRQASALLDLTVSNPTENFDAYPHEEIRRAFCTLADFRYKPDPFGELSARRTICDWYRERGIDVAPHQVVLTASSSESYSLLFKLFCDAGDEILAPIPSYPLFEYLAQLESVRIVPYRLRYDGSWFIDFAHLRQRLSSRTRAIVLVNPNNPTGSFLKRREVHELFDLAREHKLPIISDEVFMDYSFGASAERVRTLSEGDSVLSFSLNGLSKSAGMPQMKLGWILLNGPQADRNLVRERLAVVLDTYLSVNTPVQRALGALLQTGALLRREISSRITSNIQTLDRTFSGSSAHRLHVEGGWSAVVQLPKTRGEQAWLTELVEQYSTVVHPGYLFDMEDEPYIVVSLITAPEAFTEGVTRIRTAVDS